MLVLLRHGQSTANRDNIKTGHLNVPLTDLGIAQSKEVGETYRGYSWDAIFTSDLERCLETTKSVVGPHHPQDTWVLSEELRERSGGAYEGKSYPELRKMLPPKKYKLWQRDYKAAPPNGESFLMVENRVIPYAKEYIFPLVNESKNVLVVTHHIPLAVLIGFIKRLNDKQILDLEIENAMPYVLPYQHIDINSKRPR